MSTGTVITRAAEWGLCVGTDVMWGRGTGRMKVSVEFSYFNSGMITVSGTQKGDGVVSRGWNMSVDWDYRKE